MWISPAYAQAAPGGDTGAMLTSILPLILVFAVFYFIVIRPQQKKMKEHRSMLQALKRNDKVVTAGGIVATVTKVRDDSDEVEVEIAPNVRVIVVRGTISSVVKPPAPANDAKPADAAKG